MEIRMVAPGGMEDVAEQVPEHLPVNARWAVIRAGQCHGAPHGDPLPSRPDDQRGLGMTAEVGKLGAPPRHEGDMPRAGKGMGDDTDVHDGDLWGSVGVGGHQDSQVMLKSCEGVYSSQPGRNGLGVENRHAPCLSR